MKIIDLFSGGGGLSEGFRQIEGFDFICHVEKDKSACLTLQLRNIFYYLKSNDSLDKYYDFLNGKISREELFLQTPEKIISDVLNLEINDENVHKVYEYIDENLSDERLDGIIGGPPCQAYSTIGRANNKHKKNTDNRIYLYEYYVEFLEKYNPKFFIFENVKGLLSFKDYLNRPLLPIIMEAFESAGYEVQYKLVNAEDFGVSQKRERLFLVGFNKEEKIKIDFFEILEGYKSVAPNISELFLDLPSLHAGEGCNEYKEVESSPVVREYYRRENFNILTQHVARPNNKNDLEIYRIVADSKRRGINLMYNELPKELITHSNTNSFLDRYKALNYDTVSHTVVAHIAKDGHYYIHPDINQNRSLSIREAARIQGFPDDYFFETSRTAAFLQIGNAVPPILAKKLAQSIFKIFVEV